MPVDYMTIEAAEAVQVANEEAAEGVVEAIYLEQVRRIYPSGARLSCPRCGHVEGFSATRLARLMLGGWPRHCREDMRLSGGQGAMAPLAGGIRGDDCGEEVDA